MGSKKIKPDFTCKILIIGNSSVGKTSVMRRFSNDEFSESFITTIGIDFNLRTIEIRGKKVQVQIWDTAGQERFRSITSAYYRGAQGVIIAYDVTNRESFNRIPSWIGCFRRWSDLDVTGMLIGNKCDLEEERMVSNEEGEELAKANRLFFFETSAKKNINIEDMFTKVIDAIVAKQISMPRAKESHLNEHQVGHRSLKIPLQQSNMKKPRCRR